MKKLFISLLLCVIAFSCNAQIYQHITTWYEYQRLKVNTAFTMPDDTLALQVKDSNAVAMIGKTIYRFTGYHWEPTSAATRLQAGDNVTISGAGTDFSPYIISLAPGAGSSNVVDITAAALHESTGLSTSKIYYVTDAWQWGSFMYRGMSSDGSEHNGGTVIVTADNKIFERSYDGRIDVRWFKVFATGYVLSSEDTARGTDVGSEFQSAINAAKPGQWLYVPRYNDSLYVIRTELDTIKNKPTNLWIDGYVITNGRTAFRFAGPSSGEERIHAIFGNGILYGKVNLPRHIYENYQNGTGPNWNALTGAGIEYINVHRLSVRLQRIEGFRYGVRSRNGSVPGILQYGSQENTFAVKYYQKNSVAISLESITGSSYCDKTIFTGWDNGSSRISGGLAINIDGYAPVVGDGTYNGAFRSLKFHLLIERVDSIINANGDITEPLFDFTFENGTTTGIFGRGIQAKSSGANYVRNPRWKFRGAVCTQHMVDSMGRGGSIEGAIYLNCTNLVATRADINEYGQIEVRTRKLSLYLRSLLPPIFRVLDEPYLNDEIVVTATNYTPGDTGRTFRMTNGGTFNLPGTAATPGREVILINDNASSLVTVTGVKSGFNSIIGARKSGKFVTNGLTWYPLWEPPSSSGGGGTGNVTGPSSSTDGALPVFDGALGNTLRQLVGTGYLKLSSNVATVQSSIPISDLSGSGASAQQSIRRNSANNGWEWYTPSSGGTQSWILNPANLSTPAVNNRFEHDFLGNLWFTSQNIRFKILGEFNSMIVYGKRFPDLPILSLARTGGSLGQLIRINPTTDTLEFFTPDYIRSSLAYSNPSWITSLAASKITGTLPASSGGTGLSTLGTAGQQIRVNSGGTALEYFTPAGSSAPNYEMVYSNTATSVEVSNTTSYTTVLSGSGSLSPVSTLPDGSRIKLTLFGFISTTSGSQTVNFQICAGGPTYSIPITLPGGLTSEPVTIELETFISGTSNKYRFWMMIDDDDTPILRTSGSYSSSGWSNVNNLVSRVGWGSASVSNKIVVTSATWEVFRRQ